MTKEPPQDLGGIARDAVDYLFLVELLRGMGVTLGSMFKEPATINYPFEKGPLSPRYGRRLP